MKKKKKKLKLEDIKAESFVTKLDEPDANTVKGGISIGMTIDDRQYPLKIDPKKTV